MATVSIGGLSLDEARERLGIKDPRMNCDGHIAEIRGRIAAAQEYVRSAEEEVEQAERTLAFARSELADAYEEMEQFKADWGLA